MKHFKVYGCKRSGTNYISALLEKNFSNAKVFMNLGGWKHGPFTEYPNVRQLYDSVDHPTRMAMINETGKYMDLFKNSEVNFFACCKNPYTWVLSFCRDNEWELDERNVFRSMLTWNQTYENYRPHIKSGKMHLIRYEDVLQDMGSYLKNLETKYSLERKEGLDEFVGVTNHLKPNADSEIGQTFDRKFTSRDFYLNQEVRNIYTDNQIAFINQCLSPEIMELLGYSYITI